MDLDTLINRLLPVVLADRDLGNGRQFTRLHLDHLWALSCLHSGECFDREIVAQRIPAHLPPRVQIAANLQQH
jgi:hypothetical protein